MVLRDIDSWKTDWQAFVLLVAQLHIDGLSDAEISERLGNTTVHWRGRIAEMKLQEEYARGVSIEMSHLLAPLRAGERLEAKHIFVNVDAAGSDSWIRAREGMEVAFEAKLVVGAGPFPGVQVSKDETSRDALLLLGLDEGRLVARRQ